MGAKTSKKKYHSLLADIDLYHGVLHCPDSWHFLSKKEKSFINKFAKEELLTESFNSLDLSEKFAEGSAYYGVQGKSDYNVHPTKEAFENILINKRVALQSKDYKFIWIRISNTKRNKSEYIEELFNYIESVVNPTAEYDVAVTCSCDFDLCENDVVVNIINFKEEEEEKYEVRRSIKNDSGPYTLQSELVEAFPKRVRSTKAQIKEPYFALSFKLIYSICRAIDRDSGDSCLSNRFNDLIKKAVYNICFYTPTGKHRLSEIEKMFVDYQGCCVAVYNDGKDEQLLTDPDNNRESRCLHLKKEDPLKLIVSTKKISEYLESNWRKYHELKRLSDIIDSIDGGRTSLSNENIDTFTDYNYIADRIDIDKILNEMGDILDNSSFILLDSRHFK